ncbi:MAG: hypothetical protein JW889_03660 [Verrucomicrobia bacterium]|nr:hypothetical protein [Verrucomicrobiota bacterium]
MRRFHHPNRASWLLAALVLVALAASPPAKAAEPEADEMISLPLKDLGIVIDRTGKGVYLPYDELLKIWALAREHSGKQETPPPARSIVRSVRYAGTLKDDAIALTAVIEVELLTDEWTAIGLDLRGVAVTRALDGDGPLALGTTVSPTREAQGMPSGESVADVRGKGTHTLTIEGSVALDEKGTRFDFAGPAAAVSLLELRAPSGRKVKVERGLLVSHEDVGDGTTRHAFLLGSSTGIRGSLSAADETPRAPGIVFARTDTLVGFGPDTVTTRSVLSLMVRHMPVELLTLHVPGGVKVVSVTGPLVADWDVRQENSVQRVTVRLTRRVEDRTAIELATESFYDQTDTSFEVPVPVVDGATDSRGFIGVTGAPVARVFVGSVEGLVQANPAELLGGEQAQAGPSVFAVYRYHGAPGRMTLGFEWPERKFDVTGTTLVDLQRDEFRVNAVLSVQPRTGSLYDVDVALPPGYEILDVAGAPARGVANLPNAPGRRVQELVLDWDVEDGEDGARVLRVRLPRRIEPPQALVLVVTARKLTPPALASNAPKIRVTEPLPGFVVQGAETQTGRIGIAADTSYLVEDEAVEHLEPAAIEELNAAGLAGAGLRFGYAYGRPPFSARLVVSRKRPLIQATTGTTVAVHGDVIDVLALTEFDIRYSTLNEVLLRLPAGVDPDTVEITGDNIRDRRRLSDEEKSALGQDGDRIWRITLDVAGAPAHPGASEVYALSIAYRVKVSGGDAPNWIPLPNYGAMPDVEADRGFIAVIANREIELGTKVAPLRAGLRAIDKADLPERLFPSTQTARVLFAYQYAAPPEASEALGLVVKAHPRGDVLPALVREAEIVVAVSQRDGAYARASLTILNNERAVLRMRLPKDAVLWGVRVDDAEIRPRLENGVHIIPISATAAALAPVSTPAAASSKATDSSEAGQRIVVVYWLPTPELIRGGGRYSIRFPSFEDLEVREATLVIYQPSEFAFTRLGGNMELKTAVRRPPLLLRWLGSADEVLTTKHPILLPLPDLSRPPEMARRGRPLAKYEGEEYAMEEADDGDYDMEKIDAVKAADTTLEVTDIPLRKKVQDRGTSEARQRITEKLETNIPKADFKDAELREIINSLAQEAGVNIVIDPAVFSGAAGQAGGAAAGGPMTINLKNVPLKHVLSYVLRNRNLKYVVEDYALLIVPIDHVLPEDLETETFQISRARVTFADGSSETIHEFLRRADGVSWPAGSDIVFHEPTSTLIVRNTPANMVPVRDMVRIWDAPGGPDAGRLQALTRKWDETSTLPATVTLQYKTGLVTGLMSLNIEPPLEGGPPVVLTRLSSDGEVIVRYASNNALGRMQTVVVVLTLLVGFWLRKTIAWSRTGFVLFVAAVCTIGPGLSNYWTTPYWDMVTKGALLLVPMFLVDYIVRRAHVRFGHRAGATAALVLGIAMLGVTMLGVPSATAVEPAGMIDQDGRRIYIPFTQVEKAGLGADTGVYLPFDEFVRLWEQAYPELVRVKAPRDYALTNALYRGRIEDRGDAGRVAVFTASFDVAVLDDKWTTVPLPLGGMAIEQATLDGADAPLTIIEGAPVLVFERAGQHRLTLEFVRPISGVVEQGSLRLALPPVEVASFELEVPVAGVEFRSDAPRPGLTEAADGASVYRLPAGGLTALTVSWRQKGAAQVVGRAIFHHAGTMRLFLDETMALGEFVSQVTLVRGELERLFYEVPLGATILDVAGGGVADWQLEQSEGKAVLVVEFSQPVTAQAGAAGPISIAFALPHAGPSKPSAYPDIVLRDAQSDSGSVELYTRHGLEVTLPESTGLEPRLKPTEARTVSVTGLHYEPRLARTMPRRPFALTLQVDVIPSEWRVRTETLYTLDESRVALESRLAFVPESGSLFEVQVEVPAGFGVLAITGESVTGWRLADPARNLVAVQLSGEQAQRFAVRLVAEQKHDAIPAALQLGAPTVVGVIGQQGVFAVAFSEAWEIIEPREADGMETLLTADAPAWMRASGLLSIRRAARYWDGTTPRLTFGMRQIETTLSATVAEHLSLFSDEAVLRVLVAYSVDGQPVRDFQFTAPRELREGLRVIGEGLRGPARRTGDAADGRDVWTVSFHSPVTGVASFEVRWRAEIPADRRLAVPRIGSVGAKAQTVYVIVENLAVNEVAEGAREGLAELPPDQVPVLPPGASLASIVLAYRSVAAEWHLELSAVTFEVKELIPAQVQWAKLETVVDREGRARTRMTLTVLNRTEQFLRVTFPDEVELWALSVAGEPAVPSRGETADTVLLPLIKTGLVDAPFDVILIYSHRIGSPNRPKGRRLSWTNSFDLKAPAVEGLPVNMTEWHLYLPDEYRTVRFGGNMEPRADVLNKLERLRQRTEQVQQLQTMAEQATGKVQEQAIGNLYKLAETLEVEKERLSKDVERGKELLRTDGDRIRRETGLGQDQYAGQLNVSQQELEEIMHSIKEINVRNVELSGSLNWKERAAAPSDRDAVGNRSLTNWFYNPGTNTEIVSEEIQRATKREFGQALNPQDIVPETVGGDQSWLNKNIADDISSNAAFYEYGSASAVQGKFNARTYDSWGMRLESSDSDRDTLGKQKAYVEHQQRVSSQAVRRAARSLAFDIPTAGRKYVFAKLNAEAVIRVRQMRASAWHAIKTILAFIVLAIVVWIVGRLPIADRVRRSAGGHHFLALFVALTAALVLLVLIGRFRYGVPNTVLLLGLIAWLIYWAHTAARRRRAMAAAAGTGGGTTQTEEEEEEEEE